MPLVQIGSAARQKFTQVTLPYLGLWGAAGGTLLFFAAEFVPRLRMDLYSNLPIIGQYPLWQKYKGWKYGG